MWLSAGADRVSQTICKGVKKYWPDFLKEQAGSVKCISKTSVCVSNRGNHVDHFMWNSISDVGIISVTGNRSFSSFLGWYEGFRLTCLSTVRWVNEASPLVKAGHCMVSFSLSTLTYFLLSPPSMWQERGWGIRQDAHWPVPPWLWDQFITHTLLRFHQWIQVLLQTALPLPAPPWEGDKIESMIYVII